MANMWYSKEMGGFVRRVPGTDKVIPVGGTQDTAMSNAYMQKKDALRNEINYDRNKDYSEDYGNLFGAEHGGELYYGGPNKNWWHAMDDRLSNRKSGNWNSTGWYEGSTSTMDDNLQRQLARRNNAIESMMREGYSHQQVLDHMSGKVNALEQGADWTDFNKARDEYMATLNPGDRYEKQWFDKYYKGAGNQHIIDWYNENNPGTGTGGGFMGGYNGAGTANDTTQATRQRPSVGSLFDSFIKEREQNGRS